MPASCIESWPPAYPILDTRIAGVLVHDAEPVVGRVSAPRWRRPIPCNCMPNIAPLWVDLLAIADEVAPAVVISSHFTPDSELFVPDSRQAWTRLAVAVMIASVGAVGMWSVVVVM